MPTRDAALDANQESRYIAALHIITLFAFAVVQPPLDVPGAIDGTIRAVTRTYRLNSPLKKGGRSSC